MVNMLSPPVMFLLTEGMLLLSIIFVIFCVFVFVILSCLFLATLWSPAGKGLTSWLSCM